jgi:CheY-like chemotaxis protein
LHLEYEHNSNYNEDDNHNRDDEKIDKDKKDYSQYLSNALSSHISEDIDSLFDSKRWVSIDVISVDKQSRITLTKKAKKVIPLEPGDNISIYQDRYSKRISLKVQKCIHHQQKENEIENWILTIRKETDDIPFKNNKQINKKIKINPSLSNIFSTDKIKETLHDTKNQVSESLLSREYSFSHKQNTLYSTPIILIDDDSDILFNFDVFLKDEGYNNVKTFSNSKNMLKHLFDFNNALHYKMAILDIRMPNINGIQTYQILKILNPSIKVIFMTALDAVDELTSIYLDIKPEDIMRKPIDREKFIQTVNGKVSTLLGGGSIVLFISSLILKVSQDSLFI